METEHGIEAGSEHDLASKPQQGSRGRLKRG